ncbi:hypothetical protein D9C73_028132 [Collichthys lucidus]|uniref:DUF5641 domain-containing protein n=1 Tax=Collichthys lucidus TaxID=240159 RepID=A0A4U5TXL9_COLLU|nr:hypothetical protein D9C73_028132 [Collichthys lucidus]
MPVALPPALCVAPTLSALPSVSLPPSFSSAKLQPNPCSIFYSSCAVSLNSVSLYISCPGSVMLRFSFTSAQSTTPQAAEHLSSLPPPTPFKFGDSEAFDAFALSIQSLVGTLEGQNGYELRCGSHVDRLLSKMPPSYRDGFVEYCLKQGILRTASGDQSHNGPSSQPRSSSKPKPYCPHCDNKEHFLNACTEFKKLNTNQVVRTLISMRTLQQNYKHLRHLPLPPVDHAKPLLLIESDMAHLLTPIEPVQMGPPGDPIAVHIELGWSLQDRHTAGTPAKVTRSQQDQQALNLLQTSTVRVNIEGVQRYATPLLRRANSITLQAPIAVLPSFRSTERDSPNPQRAEVYCREIHKLEKMGYIAVVPPEEATSTPESWFIPHHMVRHNNKDRIVFNCSFQHGGKYLNDLLLPGPALGPSLLGVLIRFRQYPVAVSGDIKGMFRQICLLPADKPVLRFIWRDMKRTEEPKIYEWQVLPFGTTCSPCCAINALQRHVQGMAPTQRRKRRISSTACTSYSTLGLRDTSESSELWLSQSSFDLQEPTLGLRWDCLRDSLKYKHRPVEPNEPTLRNVYKVLACQYDPLGYIVPFTTRAKILVQDLWKEQIGWDEPIQPQSLRDRWLAWVQEIPDLIQMEIPRFYAPASADSPTSNSDLHIFCLVWRQKSTVMPRLELSAALTGQEDHSLSLTEVNNWRYVDSANNPADDITRGKTLMGLSRPHRWHHGPDFLRYTEDHWPTNPTSYPETDDGELKKSSFCGHVTVETCLQLLDVSQFSAWKDLMRTTAQSLHGAANPNSEGILNAKPLGYVSSDIADPDPITPSILLMGRHDALLPQAVYNPSNTLRNRRWRHSQDLIDHFWSRFISHYLPSLQERQKWLKDGNSSNQTKWCSLWIHSFQELYGLRAQHNIFSLLAHQSFTGPLGQSAPGAAAVLEYRPFCDSPDHTGGQSAPAYRLLAL